MSADGMLTVRPWFRFAALRLAPLRFAVLGLIALVPACAPETADTSQTQTAASPAQGEPTDARSLLARSIDFHDPTGAWSSFAGTLQFNEIRPDGAARNVDVTLDVGTGAFSHSAEVDGERIVKAIDPTGCSATIAGREPDPEAVREHRLECPQIERNRNYYLYLWGLPMKLLDPGTHVDPEVVSTMFEGRSVDQIRVTYDPDVGGDTWYFYFEPDSARMVGYRFYHDESQNDGEYITLAGETHVGSMRIPAERRWFVNADDRFLGEDVLMGHRQ